MGASLRIKPYSPKLTVSSIATQGTLPAGTASHAMPAPANTSAII